MAAGNDTSVAIYQMHEEALPFKAGWHSLSDMTTRFPQMRLYLRASAVATPVLLFVTLLLLFRGDVLWALLPAIIAVVLVLNFPFWLMETPMIATAGMMDGPTWMRRVATYGVFLWCFQFPEVKALLDRVTRDHLLWDWRLIVPAALVTLSYIWMGWRNVSAITDKAIYTHYCLD